MSSKWAMAKGKSFNTLFISSLKYASACANPKGTFRYSYFANVIIGNFMGYYVLY